MRRSGRPAARHLAEMACWEAVAGHYSRGLAYAQAALRYGRTEPLTLLAFAAAVGLARGRRVVSLLRRPHLIP